MELFISEAEIEDASMIIDYLNQVGGESDNLTYGLNECYLNEFEEMEVIQDFIDQENSLLLCGFIDDELVSLLSIQGEQKAKAIKDLTQEAVEGAGTNIEYLEQAIKAIDSPEDRRAVEAKLKEYCEKKRCAACNIGRKMLCCQ